MRIAQISPLYESVPPKLYGGTERIVHYLTEELVRQGHEVTLFASGDSRTSARLEPMCERALRLEGAQDCVAHHLLMLERAFAKSGGFDIIHSHVDYLAYPFIRRHPQTPVITTLHGRLDLPDLPALYREYGDMPVVSISDAQRGPLPGLNWIGTVYHGMPEDLYPFQGKPGRYLAFLGRISPEKRLDSAIAIALRAGLPLEIAAKVDAADREYFQARIEPMLDHPLIKFHGEIGDGRKPDFLGNALALLFPVDWPEPFGLVMIEAMACGTPVIARRRGSVPEVMKDGVSGFVVENDDEAVAALEKVPALSRAACRAYFETRFAAARMAEDYLALYRRAVGEKKETVDWRANGGSHQLRGQVLHNGQLLPGRKAEPNPQARGDLRRIR